MKNSFFVLFVAFCLFSISSVWGQKKVIDHQAFDQWKTLKSEQISKSGNYVTYEIQPLKGDGYLYWYNTKENRLDSVIRGTKAKFSSDEKHLVYTLEPGYDTLRKVELNKVDKKKWPKDSLAIYSFSTNKTEKIANIKSFQLNEKHAWLGYLSNDNKLKDTSTAKKKKSKKKTPEKKEPKSDGTVLTVRNLENNKNYTFKNVTSYQFSEKGELLALVQNQNDTTILSVVDLNEGKIDIVQNFFKAIEGVTFDKQLSRCLFLASSDTTKTKIFKLYNYTLSNCELNVLIDTTSQQMPKGITVSQYKMPEFSKYNNGFYFGAYAVPQPEKKDTLLESEKVKLDIWTYNEPELHTQQLNNLQKDLKKAYWFYYDLSTNKVVQLENDTLDLQADFKDLQQYALVSNNRPYALSSMWDISGKRDYYRINLQTGATQLIKNGVANAIRLSRKGDLFVYFQSKDANYYAVDLEENTTECITCAEKNRTWTADKNGMPMDDEPLGNLGWNKAGTHLFLKEKNDFFVYDFSKNTLINLTNNEGVKHNIEFDAARFQTDSNYVELDEIYLLGIEKSTKSAHFYTFKEDKMQKQGVWDAKITSVKKAKDNTSMIIRKMNVHDYPEVFLSDNSSNDWKQISVTNPQQVNYNWATVELISWKSYKGIDLQGLVYRPENFDSTKRYPLLVYFYEMYSDDLHNHYVPKPTASIIFPTEYASAGYVVFIPDIRYEPGHPAKSAYDCIMSGTDAVLKKFPQIDASRMGLQGQSWGGYQTAQLITMTNRYKAAMAGAPVSNMFSAYGGIRWGSGMSRQFQYEKTQSRIGKTIWEAPELYVENSPVFHLPKVTTPLLIMHNDKDGAVPWYQGIELFAGLRRLGKTAWLLNYNDDDHNLMKIPNRRDLSRRMRQFFDHYLQNQPAPRWMVEGIPAVKKDKETRYELD